METQSAGGWLTRWGQGMADTACQGCRYLKMVGSNHFCFSETATRARKSALPDAAECQYRQEPGEAAQGALGRIWRWYGRGTATS